MSENVVLTPVNTQEELCIRILEYVQEKSPKLYILTPCFGGVCYVNYIKSMTMTMELFHQFNFPVQFEFCKSDSLITRARNNLIAKAMGDPEMTYMLFIDNDLMWNPMDILKMILADKGIIGGIYPLKKYHWSRLISHRADTPSDQNSLQNTIQDILQKRDKSDLKLFLSDEAMIQSSLLSYNINYLSKNLVIDNNLTQVRHIPTGFMLIQRSTIESMHQAHPEIKYKDDVGFLTENENNFAYALFDCGVRDGHYFSEDWMFCERWISLQGEIWADVSICLTHTGIEDYKGSYIASLI